MWLWGDASEYVAVKMYRNRRYRGYRNASHLYLCGYACFLDIEIGDIGDIGTRLI